MPSAILTLHPQISRDPLPLFPFAPPYSMLWTKMGTKYLRGECGECGGHIEFPAEAAGTIIDCPHCGKETELLLARPPEEPSIPRRTIIWTVSGILVLLFGLGASLVALRILQRRAGQAPGPPPAATDAQTAPATNAARTATAQSAGTETPGGFRISAITLEKTPGSSLVYAVGVLSNPTVRQRFGVKLELDLLDAAGQKVGAATDYQQVIEPNGQWHFHALVVEKKAASATLAAVKEDQ